MVTKVSKGGGSKVAGTIVEYKPVDEPTKIEQVEEITEAPKINLDSKKTSFVEYNGESLFSSAVKNEETNKYVDDTNKYDSITGDVIPLMQTKPFSSEDTKGTRAANKAWEGIDPATKLDTLEFGAVNKEQYQKLVDTADAIGRARGTIFHKKIHFFVTGDPITEAEIQSLYQDYQIFPSEYD